MMQGDPRVDTIMWPILLVIRRYVKNLDAVTDIYNRTYEALMMSMDALDVSAKVTAKQIAENAKNLQRAEKAEADAANLRRKLQNERDLSDELYLLLVDNPNTKLLADKILVNRCARVGAEKGGDV